MKICSKCKVEKNLREFSKCERNIDKLQYICKECNKQYDKKYREENKEQKIEYRKNNKEQKVEYDKNYRKANKEQIKEYYNSKANYDTFAEQISYADKVRNVDGYLQTKCTYCGKWYFPTT